MRDRRDQRRIGADEGARADLGAVLVEAVVVAGDGAGADVGFGAHVGVADIGEVVDLGALGDHGVLDLDEVADRCTSASISSRPAAAAQGADVAPAAEAYARPADARRQRMVAPFSILDDHAGADDHMGLDDDVPPDHVS